MRSAKHGKPDRPSGQKTGLRVKRSSDTLGKLFLRVAGVFEMRQTLQMERTRQQSGSVNYAIKQPVTPQSLCVVFRRQYAHRTSTSCNVIGSSCRLSMKLSTNETSDRREHTNLQSSEQLLDVAGACGSLRPTCAFSEVIVAALEIGMERGSAKVEAVLP